MSFQLDLNNVLHFGILAGLIKRLQTVQNAAAPVLVHADRHTSAKPIAKKLTSTYISELISIKTDDNFETTKIYSSWNILLTLLLLNELFPLLLQYDGTSSPLQSETFTIINRFKTEL